MNVTARLSANATKHDVYRLVSDLSSYPRWLDIVPRSIPAESLADDVGPAWSVDLRGQLGPLRRSKRLRMVRVIDDAPRHVRFERRESDGRSHSDWVLEAQIDGSSDSGLVKLTMSLHYGGAMWVPLLDRLLADEIERSKPRLLKLLAEAR